MIIAIIVLSIFALKIVYKYINLSILYLIIAKLAITKSDYDDIIRLLPLTIIVYSKNYTISIIIKENITVNRQNRLIAHLYLRDHLKRTNGATYVPECIGSSG